MVIFGAYQLFDSLRADAIGNYNISDDRFQKLRKHNTVQILTFLDLDLDLSF